MISPLQCQTNFDLVYRNLPITYQQKYYQEQQLVLGAELKNQVTKLITTMADKFGFMYLEWFIFILAIDFKFDL